MAETPDPERSGGFWPEWLTPRRAFDFARNVVKLEQSVQRLREDNRDLRVQLLRLQSQLSEHNGQLRTLTAFVREAMDDKIEIRAEKAVRRILAEGSSDVEDR
ncbi:hypothetical protein [Bauldia sp.]|uniref:hypothetical protein n=1 Tax=Bauldia sp. TaxID=2575872 RepID=UPI003BA8A5AD